MVAIGSLETLLSREGELMKTMPKRPAGRARFLRNSGLSTLLVMTLIISLGEHDQALGAPATRKPKRPPTPGKQLVTAYKNLVRTKSYQVSVSIRGGISDNPEHRIVRHAVRESYTARVYRQVMHIPAMKAYRTATGGAHLWNGAWKNILANRHGVKCHRLFVFPEVLLRRALRHAKRAKWVSGTGVTVAEKTPKAEGSPRGHPARSTGRTVVRSKGDESHEASLVRFIRVETSLKEALRHVLEVENSGCLSGG